MSVKKYLKRLLCGAQRLQEQTRGGNHFLEQSIQDSEVRFNWILNLGREDGELK